MKLKRFVFIFLPALVLVLGFKLVLKDDNYKVIKVNGSIQIKKTGKTLQQGDIYKEGTQLQFNSPDSKATVINSEKGRFVITSKSNTSTGNNLIPAINNIASRGGAMLTIIDLKNLFQGNLCVIGKMKVKISTPTYKMNKESYFYLQYVYKGEEINKALAFSGDTLIINKAKLYVVDGKIIDGPDGPNVNLFFLDKNKKGHSISSFNLIFPDEKELLNETEIILGENKSKTSTLRIDDLTSFINEFYGKVDKDDLKFWLSKNFGLK